MKIKEIEIKNFGKFSNQRFVFRDGTQVFYGENEFGKSTIYGFLKAMLFGMERGRGKAAHNDAFSRFEPWENPNEYAGTMRFSCGEKTFCLKRRFDRYTKGAVLICEDDGEEFSLEHGDLEMILNGLNASNYENTVAVAQMKIEPTQSLAAEIQNYATNYYSTGNSDIDLDGALNRLNKKKKEVEGEIRKSLQEKQQRRYEIEQETTYLWRDIHKLEQEMEEIDGRIGKEELRLKEACRKYEGESKWRVSPIKIAIMAVILIMAFVIFQKPWNYLVTIVLMLAEGMYVWNRMKEGKKKPRSEVEEEERRALDKLLWEKEHLQGELKEKQVQYGNVQERLSELDEVNDDHKKQDMRKRALELATERLLELSKDVHKELGVKLNEKASEILSEITDGKYTMLLIDEKLKMSLYTGERKIGIEQVSRGTIEQIYFALRMAASELLHEEEYPVILDDTFVFYDDKRLENTLKWLAGHKKQVLIFTCQKREQQILKKLGIGD